jgi:hypothetical protein
MGYLARLTWRSGFGLCHATSTEHLGFRVARDI